MNTTGFDDDLALMAAFAELEGLCMEWAARDRGGIDDPNDGCELTGDELGLNRFVRDF